MKHPKNTTALIAQKIGSFFLEQNDNDYAKTEKFIRDLHITDITEISEGKIQISTARPGLLIGKKGQNIDGLQTLLGRKIHIFETFSWDDLMIPCDYLTEMTLEDEYNAYHEFSSFLEMEYSRSDMIESEKRYGDHEEK